MKNVIYIMLVISISGFSLLGYSDDTEIHLGNSFSELEPNVIFIMDTSGSMSESTTSSQDGPSRLEVVKEIAIDTINNTENINISLMSFNSSGQGASLNLPLTPIVDARSDFTQIMNSYGANGGTPITESLDEALRYLRGDTVDYGEYDRYDNPGVLSAMNSARNQYIKPIANQCQKNHIILFSDGEPTGDTDSNNYILNRINAINDPRKADLTNLNADADCSGDGGYNYATSPSYINQGRPFTQNGISYTYDHREGRTYFYRYRDKSGICAEDIALLAQLENFSPDPSIHQNVTIHTVGGFVGGDAQEKLKNIAKFGSPDGAVKLDGSGLPLTYYTANSATELAAELEKLFHSISNDGSIFTAPSVSVNAFNSLELSDELYYAVFKPNKKSNWAGNLKRYRLALTTTGASIVGQDELPAINDATGFFKETAVSFWSDSDLPPDGLEVTKGGMAQHLTAPRNIKTVKDGRLVNFSSSVFTPEELNIVGKSDSYRLRLLDWAQGIDVNAGPNSDGRDEDNKLIPRLTLEDPLHSEPTIITYSSDKTTNKKDRTLFLGTNSGFLHAFDVDKDEPKEYFSFIPQELIQNLDKYYSGGSFYDNKTYGVDGPLTHWHDDTNDNGQVDGRERVYLYMTLRRGGQSFYALDVTDRTNPTLLWQMHGDYPTGFPNKPEVSDKEGYSKLGQTWARLEPATVMWKGALTSVLFTAGGYDPSEDGTTSNGPSIRSKHTMGTTIYMIKAMTGEVLWDASIDSPSREMTSSFAAHVSPVDSTGDGRANIIFAADTGGRVWRFDIGNEHTSENLRTDFATSHLLADISTGTGTGNRRFFNEVDVIYREKEKDILLSVGSGYRAHPLSLAVTDYHFIIKTTIDKPDSGDDVISESELTNWGSVSAHGWKIPLTHQGEKVLARSNTSSGAILFTTFAPKSSNAADLCSSSPGIATLYLLNNDTVRHIRLVQGGIPAMPVIARNKHANEDGSTVSSRATLVGTEVVDFSKDDGGSADEPWDGYDHISKDYWLENN